MPNIAVLTSGGDSPGMNAAVMSVARSANLMGLSLIGIKRGFNGLIGKSPRLEDDIVQMSLDQILDIADLPGTFLRTARCKEFLQEAYQDKAVQLLKQLDVLGLVVIGGDGSFQGAQALARKGIPTIGIPGTIDNDLGYSEMSLGFDTAVNVCVDAVRAIRATSRSHDRAAVVEVMGRNCGDIALNTAQSTGSEIVIVPEIKGWDVDDIARRLDALVLRGNRRATIVVAEGAYKTMAPFDLYGYLSTFESSKPVLPGQQMDSYTLSRVLEHKCANAEVRGTVIGYTQRGRQPSARDAAFAFEAGVVAVNLLKHGESNRVVGVHNGKVFHMEIEAALQIRTTFNRRMFNMVNAL
ncbi:MAG: ATP-dependent 6-phosphofructokinase [Christensenellales bacterium]